MGLCYGIIFCFLYHNVNYPKICAVGIGGFDGLGVLGLLLKVVIRKLLPKH